MSSFSEEEVMSHPLILWVQTFKEGDLDYTTLVDGAFLNHVMAQINPRYASAKINQDVNGEINLRIQNLANLMKSIKAFYLESLEQLIVMKLPDIISIAKDPMQDASALELKKLLLLMLGCAVQCDQKEIFIEKIKQLDIDVQQSIVIHIQEVTDNTENVFSLQWGDMPNQLDLLSKSMFTHVKRLASERDDYSKLIIELSQEKLDANFPPSSPSPVSPSNLDKQRQTTIELAESKSKLRRLRQDLEERNEIIIELKEENEKVNSTLQSLRQENLDLTQDARAARAYRDELDVYKEMALKAKQYEVEISKYKDKMNEMDYLSRRIEELRDDNQLLVETKTLLEDQLETANSKLDKAREIEADKLVYQEQIEVLEASQDEERKNMQELTEELAKLRVAHSESMTESTSLGMELERAKTDSLSGTNSFMSELNASASTKNLKLEKEIQGVKKENQRLTQLCKKFEQSGHKDVKKNLEVEQGLKKLKEEKGRLEETLTSVRENLSLKEMELEEERRRYDETVEKLQERNQKDINQRIKDVEEENKRLNDNIKQAQSRITKLEYENKQIQKTCEKLRERAERSEVIEKHNLELESEKETMSRKIEMLTMMCEKCEELEKFNTELEVEKSKRDKLLESLKAKVSRYELVESEYVKLKANEGKLQMSLGAMKDTASKITTLEMEKEELDRQNRQLQKNLENLKTTQERINQLEVDHVRLETENKRLDKTVHLSKEKNFRLETENQNLETEIEKLKKTIDSLKLSNKKAEEIEKELRTLEIELSSMENERSRMEKENKRLKQSLESRENLIDEANAKVTGLEQEIKMLHKTAKRNKDVENRVKEYEKENKELMKQATMEKKTMATIREELVNEKIKAQQFENELEKLTSELDKIGVNKEKLLQQELSEDETRFKALESRMDDALKKNLEIKEDKIKNLEIRWKESVNRNQMLADELSQVQQENEILRHKQEEKTKQTPKNEKESKVKRNVSDRVSAKEIMHMKDHLVDLERSNATLLTQNNNLRDQVQLLTDQLEVRASEAQNSQTKRDTIVEENTNLKMQSAKLQVENSTLKSQNINLQSRINSEVQDFEKLRERYDDLDSNHDALLNDHANILLLHENLTEDYDILNSEHNNVKGLYRDVKSEHLELATKLAALERKSRDAAKVASSSEDLRSSGKSSSLQVEYNFLERSHSRLNQEYNEVGDEFKTLKAQYRSLQLDHTTLQGQYSEARDQYLAIEMERAKLEHRCEMLDQYNSNLEEENRKLMEQLSHLMAQNSELLVQTLESKELHHEEHRQLEDQLHNLRRQKEKLEEKIMDQYKSSITPHKKIKSGLNLNFMKKIYKAKSKEKKRHHVELESHHHDSFGETSSAGSGVESWDGNSGADSSRKSVDESQDRRSSLDNGSTLNRPGGSKTRSSVPQSVLEVQVDSMNREYFSMSTEDIRIHTPKKSNLTPAVSTPVLTDDAFDSDRVSPGGSGKISSSSAQKLTPQGSRSASTSPLHDISPIKSTPELNTNMSASSSSRADAGSAAEEDTPSRYTKKSSRTAERVGRKGSSVGMLSRIKSRSKEILTDLRAGSVENLAEELEERDQKTSPDDPDIITSLSREEPDITANDSRRSPVTETIETTTDFQLSAQYADDVNKNISSELRFEFPEEILLTPSDNLTATNFKSPAYSPRPFSSKTNDFNSVTKPSDPLQQVKRKERPKSAIDLGSKRRSIGNIPDSSHQSPSQQRRSMIKTEKPSNGIKDTPKKVSPLSPPPQTEGAKKAAGDAKTDAAPNATDAKGEKEKKKNSVWYEYGCV